MPNAAECQDKSARKTSVSDAYVLFHVGHSPPFVVVKTNEHDEAIGAPVFLVPLWRQSLDQRNLRNGLRLHLKALERAQIIRLLKRSVGDSSEIFPLHCQKM
jgi:hypothetical protein